MARCLVVGSIAVDEVVRLRQPLRPGGHLEGLAAGRRLGGGAAGTAVALADAGHRVTCVAAVGDDAEGGFLLSGLAARGVDTSAIVRVEGASTRSLVLVDPDGERTVVNLHRCAEPGPPERLRSLRADALYVRSREPGLASLLREKAHECLVVAHVPPTLPGSRPAHVLVGSASDLDAGALEAPWALGLRVGGDGLRFIVITRGERGATAHSAGEALAAEAPRVAALDTTGAGDVFAAGLVHALVAGAGMREALETAVRFGAAAAASEGLPSRETIERLGVASR